MAITLFSEDPSQSSPEEQSKPATESSLSLTDRVHRLEHEVADLRSVVTRFADIVIGEVKELHERKANLSAPPPELASTMPIATPGLVSQTGAVVPPASSQRRRWLLTDCIRDIRTTIQMYLDPQYRVRRSTQLMVPLIIGLFVFNGIFFTYVFSVPVISTILEKIGDILLAIILYKVLHQEMERYREAVIQYSAWRSYQATQSDFITMTTDPAHPPTTRQETE